MTGLLFTADTNVETRSSYVVKILNCLALFTILWQVYFTCQTVLKYKPIPKL